MRDIQGDLWGFAEHGFADVLVVTTNASINHFGRAVMGRGCAKQAAERYPELPQRLATYIHLYGNRPFILKRGCEPTGFTLVSMPVKHRYYERADERLIIDSAEELARMAVSHNWQSIVLPRAGCGNGHLDWADIKPLLEEILDDRFTAVTFERDSA